MAPDDPLGHRVIVEAVDKGEGRLDPGFGQPVGVAYAGVVHGAGPPRWTRPPNAVPGWAGESLLRSGACQVTAKQSGHVPADAGSGIGVDEEGEVQPGQSRPSMAWGTGT